MLLSCCHLYQCILHFILLVCRGHQGSHLSCDASSLMFQKWKAELLTLWSSSRNTTSNNLPLRMGLNDTNDTFAWPTKPLVTERLSAGKLQLLLLLTSCRQCQLTVNLVGCSRSSVPVKRGKRTWKHTAIHLHRGGHVTDNQAVLLTGLWYIFLIKQDFRNFIPEDFITSALGFVFSVPFQLIINKQPAFLYIFFVL